MHLQQAILHKSEVLILIEKIFSNLSGLNYEEELRMVNWDLSVVLVNNNKPIGFLLLGEENDPFHKLKGKGLQGVALGLEPEFRNQGYRKIFLDYAVSLDYDYIWGEHDKRLNNLHQWLRVAIFLGENNDSYFTYQNLKKIND